MAPWIGEVMKAQRQGQDLQEWEGRVSRREPAGGRQQVRGWPCGCCPLSCCREVLVGIKEPGLTRKRTKKEENTTVDCQCKLVSSFVYMSSLSGSFRYSSAWLLALYGHDLDLLSQKRIKLILSQSPFFWYKGSH